MENADRVRIIFQDLAPAKTRGQHFDYVTPAHQDGYHFRVSFVTCWVALMDIDRAWELMRRYGPSPEMDLPAQARQMVNRVA